MVEFGIYYLVFLVIFYLTFESRKDIGKNIIEININFIKYMFFLYPKNNQKKQSRKEKKARRRNWLFRWLSHSCSVCFMVVCIGKALSFIKSITGKYRLG